jgi:hypothetical protein
MSIAIRLDEETKRIVKALRKGGFEALCNIADASPIRTLLNLAQQEIEEVGGAQTGGPAPKKLRTDATRRVYPATDGNATITIDSGALLALQKKEWLNDSCLDAYLV